MHRSDIPERVWHDLLNSPAKRLSVFRSIDVNRQGFVMLNLSKNIQKRIICKLHSPEVLDFIHYLDPDDATDLVQLLPSKRRKKIVESLDVALKEKVEFLLRFDPKSAAGVMSLDYVQATRDMRFRDVFALVEKHEIRTGKTPAILVTEEGYLIGEIPWRVLILQKASEKVSKHIKKVPTIHYGRSEQDVLQSFKSHPHNKIVVLDDDDSIIGVIYSDDVLHLISKYNGDDLYDFAGVREEEEVFDSPLTKVKHRYKWLLINLGTGFATAYIVSLFQDTISAFVLLAVYMPIVAGMGGNTGVQALAVVVRGLTLRQIDLAHSRRAVTNELIAGMMNGLIVGSLVAIIASLINQNPVFGLVIGLAMLINLSLAGFFGAIIPLVMKALGKDPANSATVFITTATDICGFFIFLSLAQSLL